jgi:septum formation protein
VLGADTVVALGGRILDKPADTEQAREWLEGLSGRTHQVVGGLCVVDDEGERSALAVTEVDFRPLSPEMVSWYLATEEWRDRAGGYAIQGRGAALVQGIRGDYLNVVGLPVATFLDLVL